MRFILGPLLLLLSLIAAPSAQVTPARRAAPAVARQGDLLWRIGPREGAPTRPKPRPSARLRQRGRDLYQSACSVCHGEKGDGQGEFADSQWPRPTDFRRAIYKLRSTPSGTLPTDEDLFGTITRGMHGTSMLRWPQLAERDRWALVFHLKSLSPRFRQERPGAPVSVPIPPLDSEPLRARGEQLYVRLQCGACHGETGAGDGSRSSNYQTPSRNFTRGRFIRGAEMEDLYVTLKVGIEGTHMASYAGLPDEDIWALAAHVRRFVRERPLDELPLVDPEAAARRGFGH